MTSAAIAFAAGLGSVATPCVLPLVPAYLSTVAAVDPAALGRRGVAGRVLRGSVPFVVGFTLVFVVLGAGAAAVAELLDPREQEQVAGFVLVVFGLAFMRLLPLPERLVAPGLLAGAQRRGSRALLGAAFAVCAAPCIGGVLAGVLVLAGDAGSVARGALLLVFYSAGIASAFVLAGVAFARAMGALRWVRDHYAAFQSAGGAVLVALGLLLFFGRFWWIRVYTDRLLNALGLET